MQLGKRPYSRSSSAVLVFLALSAALLGSLLGCTRVVSFEKPDQPSIELSSDVGAVTIRALNAAGNDSLFPVGGNLSISFKETAGNEADLAEAVYEIYDRWGFIAKQVTVIVSGAGGRPVAETGGRPIHIDRGSRNVKHNLSISVDRDVARTIYKAQPAGAQRDPVDGSLLIYYLGYDGNGDSFITKTLIATLQVDFSSDITAPAQVALVASADPQLGGTLNLDWSAYGEPSDLDFYQLYWNTFDFVNVDAVTSPALVLAATLPPGTKTYSLSVPASGTYYIAVVATDIIGNSTRDVAGSVASVDLTF